MPDEVQASVFTYLTCSSGQLEQAENKPDEKSSVVPSAGRDSQGELILISVLLHSLREHV